MKSLKIILQIALLYGIYLVGIEIQRLIHIPIPGSIIGMILLFVLLLTGKVKRHWFEFGADFLLAYLPLFFLPSVIGVMTYGHFFLHKGFILVVLVIVNTIIVMALCALTSQWLATRNKMASREESL